VYDRVFVSDAEETIIALTIVELSRLSDRSFYIDARQRYLFQFPFQAIAKYL